MLLAVAGCTAERPARLIAGLSDTVVVNTTRPVEIPLDVVDSAGHVLRSKRPRFQRLSGDSLHVSNDGRVTCARTGDAIMRASLGPLSTTFVLYCRPIRAFVFGINNYALVVGGPSKALRLVGQGVDGRPVTLLAARLSVRDSAIASLDHGRVSPRSPGQTVIQVESGDSRTRVNVEVIQLVEAPSDLRPYHAFVARIRLAGGESENWHVPPGRYELRFISDSSGHGQALLAATKSNCARYSDNGPHLSCVTREDAAVILDNQRPAGRDGWLIGKLVVRRLSDSPGVSDYWLDLDP
jgi:hypothetical protein